jgi:hypothetical protein
MRERHEEHQFVMNLTALQTSKRRRMIKLGMLRGRVAERRVGRRRPIIESLFPENCVDNG